MRALIIFSVFALAGAGLSAFGDQHRKAVSAREAGFQTDIYYFGGTYRTLVAETPEACSALCEADLRCKSWSHLPGRSDIGPACELKRNGGLPEAQPQAVSGRSPRHEATYADPVLRGLPPGAPSELSDRELAGGPR